MNQELITRVQNDIKTVDKLKVNKIEAETKIKALQESLDQDLAKANELGYSSLEELIAAQSNLEEAIKAECDEVEKAFKEAGV